MAKTVTHRVAIGVVGLGLIVLAVALLHENKKREVNASTVATITRPFAKSLSLHPSYAAKKASAIKPAESAFGKLAVNAEEAIQESSGQSQLRQVGDTRESGRTPVVGRQFPVSESVEAHCKSISTKDQDGCGEVHALLSRLAQEPKDATWAPATEAKLRDLILTEPGKYAIRAIDCRMSLCVTEVASIYGPYFGDIPSGDPLSSQVSPWIGTFGYEHDTSSGRITVTLLTFKRQ
jgi:hypothetical protein